VFARVSAGYDFIISTIMKWGDKVGKPPRKYKGCADYGGFYDIDQTFHNCMWYEQSKHCIWYGDEFAHVGLTANDACCACGGGLKVNSKASKRI
jgi:hypothetical protein